MQAKTLILRDCSVPKAVQRCMPVEASRFESLVNQHKDAVYRQMARVCGHREDAEDALATALMHAYKALPKLESDEAFRSWLGTIGRRVCSRMRHHPSIENALELADEVGLALGNDPGYEMAVLKGCVKDAVDALPESYRVVYERCELDEKTVPEAADELGLSVAAVKSRLLRARAMVREQLDHSVCAP